VTTNADQVMRGNRRLAADRNTRSAARNAGRPDLAAQHGYLVSEDDNLEVLRSGRPEPQEEQLQDALDRDVKNRQNHGTSDDTPRGPLFYADRINAPYRAKKGQGARTQDRRPAKVVEFPRKKGSSGWTRTSSPPVNRLVQVRYPVVSSMVCLNRRRRCYLVFGRKLFTNCSQHMP